MCKSSVYFGTPPPTRFRLVPSLISIILATALRVYLFVTRQRQSMIHTLFIA